MYLTFFLLKVPIRAFYLLWVNVAAPWVCDLFYLELNSILINR